MLRNAQWHSDFDLSIIHKGSINVIEFTQKNRGNLTNQFRIVQPPATVLGDPA